MSVREIHIAMIPDHFPPARQAPPAFQPLTPSDRHHINIETACRAQFNSHTRYIPHRDGPCPWACERSPPTYPTVFKMSQPAGSSYTINAGETTWKLIVENIRAFYPAIPERFIRSEGMSEFMIFHELPGRPCYSCSICDRQNPYRPGIIDFEDLDRHLASETHLYRVFVMLRGRVDYVEPQNNVRRQCDNEISRQSMEHLTIRNRVQCCLADRCVGVLANQRSGHRAEQRHHTDGLHTVFSIAGTISHRRRGYQACRQLQRGLVVRNQVTQILNALYVLEPILGLMPPAEVMANQIPRGQYDYMMDRITAFASTMAPLPIPPPPDDDIGGNEDNEGDEADAADLTADAELVVCLVVGPVV
jgi:hypothetical protein